MKLKRRAAARKPARVIILGAGGRDFHNFNTFYRNRRAFRVVAFTATQIPFISDRTYPPELAGVRYRKGIPIYPERTFRTFLQTFEQTKWFSPIVMFPIRSSWIKPRSSFQKERICPPWPQRDDDRKPTASDFGLCGQDGLR